MSTELLQNAQLTIILAAERHVNEKNYFFP